VSYKGLFRLTTPRDLLGKLQHDFSRIEEHPLDERPAFDFFVTAHHMQEWLDHWTSNTTRELRKQRKPYEREGAALMQVCSHLANGSKHFVTDSRHDSVKDTQFKPGPFSSAFSDAFDISRLEIHLDGEAAKKLGGCRLGETLCPRSAEILGGPSLPSMREPELDIDEAQ
jgi:hypothetical protein